MSFEAEPLDFKFHWLNDEGVQAGFFRKKGRFHDDTLTLDDTDLPAAVILQSQVFENRMALVVPTEDGGYGNIMIMPSNKSTTDELKKRLDIARSRTWAEAHKESLEKSGRGHAYRAADCPQCMATVVVSDMDKTSQLYCHFCDNLSTVDQSPPQGENKLGLCNECGMYSQPIKYTAFYFYFLLVVYGWRSQTKRSCRACMRSDAWKMLAGNLLFLLGVPSAIYQLIRAYSGGAMVEGVYSGLNAANIAARKQNWENAIPGYRHVLDNVGVSAGVKYNLGLALRTAGRDEQAARSFEASLQDCSNYGPAYAHLIELYPQLGEDEKLAALKEQWDDVEEQLESTGEDPEDIPGRRLSEIS